MLYQNVCVCLCLQPKRRRQLHKQQRVNDRWQLWLEVYAQLQVLATASWAQLRQVVRHRVKQKQQRVNDRWQLWLEVLAQLQILAKASRSQNF